MLACVTSIPFQPNASGYEEFSDEEITFGDDDFDQEVCIQYCTHFVCVIVVNYTAIKTDCTLLVCVTDDGSYLPSG